MRRNQSNPDPDGAWSAGWKLLEGGVAILVLATGASSTALAANGLNLIGFSGESVAMGGASVAVSRDAGALNTNPAGLAQLRAPRLDNFAAFAFERGVAHADRFGNDARVSNKIVPAGNFGFAAPLSTTLTAGVGFFAQGGAGNVYKHLRTPFGTTDDLSGLIGFAKLAPGLAWQASPDLRLGASVAGVLGRAKQRIFPDTSAFNAANPAQSFFGVEVKNLETQAAGVRIGLLYRLRPTLTLGASYIEQIDLPFKHGTARVNMSAVGLGTVTYGDARIDGLALPREVAFGLRWQFAARTFASLQTTWYHWAAALKNQTTTFSNPDSVRAPATIRQTNTLAWKNQFVFSAGLAHQPFDAVTLYGGYNYGHNPVPVERVSPLLAAIGEHHLTAGIGLGRSTGWVLLANVEYLRNKQVTYNNAELPFGPGTQTRIGYTAFGVSLSRIW